MNVLDLFGGIGAFSLGLERSGAFRTVAFCECDAHCRRVLAKHWPEVPCYDDVRSLTAERLRADGISVDVICGGFPCQDISVAGRGAGIDGERSGLWREFARLISELRPRYALVENVAALLSRGMGDVLGDLSALGYDAEWRVISAADMGAPHRRDRVWIVAYPARLQPGRPEQRAERERVGECGQPLALTESIGCGEGWAWRSAGVDQGIREPAFPDALGLRQLQPRGCLSDIGRWPGDSGWWLVEPDVGRVAHGVAGRVDRLRALGNALVPQIPELIGRAIAATGG